jgi:Ca-activated chloride channel family protein
MKLIQYLFISLGFSLIFNAVGDVKTAAPPASVEQKVIIVLDASGSMRGKTDGKTKMVVAKGMLKDLMATWDSNIEVGLVVYGHRVKGDCSDIELMVPVGSNNKAAFTEAMAKIKPMGKTPLSAAVIKAADQLGYTEQKATVILISDGIETCKMDPCTVAKKLKEKGVDFTAYVVGFDVDKAQQRDLKCIATNTGGEFFEANNAADLKIALTTVVKEVKEVKKVKKAPAHNLLLSAVVTKGGAIIQKSLSWKIYTMPANSHEMKQVEYSYNASPKFNLAPGEYVVQVTYGAVKVKEKITVSTESINKVVVLGIGFVKMSAKMTADSADLTRSLSWKVWQGTGDSKVQTTYSYNATPNFKLKPGEYMISVKYGDVYKSKKVTVKGGESTQDIIVLDAGVMNLQAATHEGGTILKSGLSWKVYDSKPNFEGNLKNITYSYNANPQFKLAAGEYLVKIKYGNSTGKATIKVEAGKVIKKTIALNAGAVKMKALAVENGSQIKSGLSWKVYEVSSAESLEGRKQIASSHNAEPRFNLPAGVYTVELSYGNVKKQYDVKVSAGALSKHDIILNVGIVKMTAATNEAASVRPSRWEVLSEKKNFEDNYDVVTSSYHATPTFKLKAGTYNLRITYQSKTYMQTFTVKAGERKTVKIKISNE